MKHQTEQRTLRQTPEELDAAVLTDLSEYRPNVAPKLDAVMLPEFEVTVTRIGSD